MKLVTNLVLGLNRAVLAEGLVFAATLGLDAGKTLDVMKASAAYSRIMDSKGEKMLHGDFEPQARLSQHLKDVRLMLAAAERTGQQPHLFGRRSRHLVGTGHHGKISQIMNRPAFMKGTMPADRSDFS